MQKSNLHASIPPHKNDTGVIVRDALGRFTVKRKPLYPELPQGWRHTVWLEGEARIKRERTKKALLLLAWAVVIAAALGILIVGGWLNA